MAEHPEPALRRAGRMGRLILLLILAAGPGQAQPETDQLEDRLLTLEEAIQIGLTNHGDVAAAAQGVEASRQRVRQSRTGILPSLTGELGYAGAGTSDLFGLFGPSRTGDSVRFDQGIQPLLALRYTVWDGGQTRLAVRQARAGVSAAEAGLGAVRNNIRFLVAVAFLEQLRAQRVLELRREQVRLAEEQLALVDARIKAQAAAPVDRALVLAQLRNTEVQAIAADNALRVAANALRNAMGLPIGPPLKLVEPGFARPEPPESLTALQETAQTRRPEILQDEAGVAIARASLQLNRLRRRPIVSGVLGLNVTPNQDITHSDYAVGATVSMPIWDAGLTHALEQEARADYESARARLAQTRKDVAAEVEEAYLNLINALQRLDASRLAVEAAEANLRAQNERYAAGVAGTVDLTTAQVQYFEASNSAIQALYDVFLAQAQLDRAIGK